MLAFLFTFGLAALLIGAGLLVNLRLRTQRLAPGRRVSGFRRAYATPMGYTPAANSRGADRSTRYTRKAVVTSLLLLVLLSVLLLGAISAAVH
jgi:hypothetical protein